MTAGRYQYATDAAALEAIGALAAQGVRDAIARGEGTDDIAWLRFAEVTARHGRCSPAARAFITTLAKQAKAE